MGSQRVGHDWATLLRFIAQNLSRETPHLVHPSTSVYSILYTLYSPTDSQTNLIASMSQHFLKLPVTLIKLKPVVTFLPFHLSISKTLITQHTQNWTPDLLPQNLLFSLTCSYCVAPVPLIFLLLKIHYHVPFSLTFYIYLGSIHFSPSLYPSYCLILSILGFHSVPPSSLHEVSPLFSAVEPKWCFWNTCFIMIPSCLRHNGFSLLLG